LAWGVKTKSRITKGLNGWVQVFLQFIDKKIFEATQIEKIKQATKSKKPDGLASNAVLGPSKRSKSGVCQDPTPSDTPSDSDTELAVPHAEDSSEKDGGRGVLYWSFL
jgi:hypothetical protein